ncbi:MAG: VWA domain-containing protein [Gemmataceae bacterium]
MPTFVHPWLLLFCCLLPLLWLRRGRTGALPFPTFRWTKAIDSPRARQAERWKRAGPAMALGLLTIAAAGPRWPNPNIPFETEGISIAVVVDVSASMGNHDFMFEGSLRRRLDGAREALKLLIAGDAQGSTRLKGRPQDVISLVAFATRPDTIAPLTLDHSVLLRMLAELDTRSGAGEATTNPGDAIAWGVQTLRSAPTRRKAILLVTDGEANVSPPALSPRQAAQIAGNLGIPVYTIDVSQEGDEGDAGKARKILQDVAAISKGAYFRGDDGASLFEATRSIDQLQRDRIEGLERRRYLDLTAWVACLGALVVIGLIGAEATVWRRLP